MFPSYVATVYAATYMITTANYILIHMETQKSILKGSHSKLSCGGSSNDIATKHQVALGKWLS